MLANCLATIDSSYSCWFITTHHWTLAMFNMRTVDLQIVKWGKCGSLCRQKYITLTHTVMRRYIIAISVHILPVGPHFCLHIEITFYPLHDPKIHSPHFMRSSKPNSNPTLLFYFLTLSSLLYLYRWRVDDVMSQLIADWHCNKLKITWKPWSFLMDSSLLGSLDVKPSHRFTVPTPIKF